MLLNLNTDIAKINRISAGVSVHLKKLGIKTVKDMLFYFPFRYDDFTTLTLIKDLQPDIKANIIGKIILIQNKRSLIKRMIITEALIQDESGEIKIVWFNQPFIIKNLKVGDIVSLAGKVVYDYAGPVITSPIYEKINQAKTIHTQGLVPNYHLTGSITQKQIRFLISQIIHLSDQIYDWLPADIKQNLNLINLNQAIRKIHFSKTFDDIQQARQRLGFDEIFLIQLRAQLIKQKLKSYKAQSVTFLEKETKKFVSSLPFQLTDAQRKSAWAILQDIGNNKPMARLLEGDVGSGKTIVAVIAMLNVALNKKLNGQSVLMVPTEILAKQHFESISKFLKNFPINIGLITKSESRITHNVERITQQDKKPIKLNSKFIIQNSQIIIGTHALIQKKIKFKNLVLAVIDEQHRFGVEQRKMLFEKINNRQQTKNPKSEIRNPKSTIPHILSMTATPIPRSLALALYGNLDMSIINEMPKNRKKIITKIVSEENRPKAYDFIKNQIKNNRQIFVICPLIDISDKFGVKSVKQEFEKLNKQIFPDLPIAILHGKLKPKEKEEIMQNFLKNKIKILVATSVVEVGIDVPNTSIMMIEGAERFGLAQLHQFRGRVGRSEHQSYCFLFTNNESEKTTNRLQAMVDYNDGFTLAKMDLKFRGPGEIYGTAQAGFPELKIASLFDHELIKTAQEQAIKLLEKDPKLNNYPELRGRLYVKN